MTKPFTRVRAAAVDGRLSNVYKRQTELERLHRTLVQNSQTIKDAIIQDTGNSIAEAVIEYHLTLASLKKQYTLLNPKKEHDDEYRIVRGEDEPDRREASGIVYIVPTSHTLLFSVIAPLSAAVAAGNCVVVQLESNLRTLPGLLRKLLRAALDTDIIDIASSRPEDAEFLAQCREVIQTGAEQPYRSNQVVSPAHERVIAVVDRTANLEEAAEALVNARFSFGGRSPYAPDFVLVNEFVKKNFLEAVVRHSIGFLTGQRGVVTGEKANPKARIKGSQGLLDEVQKEGNASIVTSGSNGTILDVEKRDSNLFRRKISECCLCVHAVSSLDDAIDFVNSTNTLLATYIFANAPSAKYLAQFIKARVAFVNHVPVQLLVGPASPFCHPVNPSLRYPSSLFSVPSPQYVKAIPESALLGQMLRSGTAKDLQQLPTILRAEELETNKRPMKYGIGFFEQGLMVGIGIAATPLLAGIGVLSWYGIRTVAGRWR